MALGLNDFEWGADPLLWPSEGVGPKNLDFFWAQIVLPSLDAISGPKKIWIFRAHPFQWPSKWIFPHQNHYARAIPTIGTLIVNNIDRYVLNNKHWLSNSTPLGPT
jgi:hypothetical protein